MRRSTLALAVAVALGAALALLACEHTASPRFPHLMHLTQLACGDVGQPDCPSCASCHRGRGESGMGLPSPQACAPCHQATSAAVTSTMTAFATLPSRGIHFEHDKHLALSKIRGQCIGCHAAVTTNAQGRPELPPMSTCLECHQADFQQGRCSPCHDRQALPKLLPQTFLRHDGSWLGRHGLQASSNELLCNQCHARSWCQDCHDTQRRRGASPHPEWALGRPSNHGGDFLSRHPMDARTNPAACLSCHTQSSCESCHLERGVSAGARGSINPHPDGWLGRDTSSPQFHGRAARRDIVSCAACHDQGPATNCIQCHRVGGPGGNPHPHGWHGGEQGSGRPCVYCHAED